MYNFIDTTSEGSALALPSEALQINGQYIEEIVDGYRTLWVNGREGIPVKITDRQIGTSHGTDYIRRHYEPRMIEIGFQLLAESPEELMEKWNQVFSILDQEEAQLIFADEPDKYYTGTRYTIGTVPKGVKKLTSSVYFYCSDPFKYSADKFYTFDENGVFSVNYKGTHPAKPTLVAAMGSDNGFVAFVDKDSHVLQFGNPLEVDTVDHDLSEVLIADNAYDMASWTANGATLHASNYKQIGTVQVKAIGGTPRLYPSSYGTDSTTWHGAAITKEIPADSNGEVGAKNFTAQVWLGSAASNVKQLGEIQVIVAGTVDGEKKTICEFHGFKASQAAWANKIQFWVGDTCVKYDSTTIMQATKDSDFDKNFGGITMKKLGSTFSFSVWGKQYSCVIDGTEDWTATEMSVFFEKYKDTSQLYGLFAEKSRFTKHHVVKVEDIPNIFSESDYLKADCGSGEVYLNDNIQYGLGALGNDWEKFELTPGVNTIQCAYSDWATAPTFILEYREVYL